MIIIMLEDLITRLGSAEFHRRAVSAGSWLFYRGDAVRSVFFVVSGEIELLRHTSSGKPAVLQRATAGSVLAEASLFSDAYHCDAIATQPSQVAQVPRAVMVELLKRDVAFAATWMTHLAHQIQAARLRSEILTLKTVSQRLDAWLAFNDGEFPERGQRIALARQIGVSPEALYREFARRKAEDLQYPK